MRVLVYKRTHTGDPDRETGIFGCNGCMGRVRGYAFDAVIGVGGTGPEPQKYDIDGKVTWIGIGPHHVEVWDDRGPGVQFDHFLLLDSEGPDFRTLAPKLATRMYDKGVRVVLHDLSAEVARILKLAENEPPSPALQPLPRPTKAIRKCVPARRPKQC